MSAAELARLAEAATPRPWERRGPEIHCRDEHSEAMPYTTVARLGLTVGNAQAEWANADLIVALVNGLPRILAALDLAEAVDRCPGVVAQDQAIPLDQRVALAKAREAALANYRSVTP